MVKKLSSNNNYKCFFCGKSLKENKNNNKFCSFSCSSRYRQSKGLNLNELKRKYHWINNIKTMIFCHNNKITKQPLCKFCNKKIKEKFGKYTETCSKSCGKLLKQSKGINKEILNKTIPRGKTIKEKIYCYNNNIIKQPKCAFCLKNNVKFYYTNGYYGKTCSKKCGQYYRNSNHKNINELKKYIDNNTNIKIKNLNYAHSINIKELIYINKNKIKAKPKCLFCNKETKFNGRKYNDFCNNTCVAYYITSNKTTKEYLFNNYKFIKSLKGKIYCHNNNITEISICECGKKKIFSNDRFICKGCTISKGENELFDFIKSIYNGNIKRNDRKTLKGLELDIYLPELKIAFEYNGDYYHSIIKEQDNDKNKYRHINKTNLCENLGIRLYQINENEWQVLNFKRIWQNHIKWKLGLLLKKDIKNLNTNYFIKNNYDNNKNDDNILIIDRRFESIIDYNKKQIVKIIPPKKRLFNKNRIIWDCGYFIMKK